MALAKPVVVEASTNHPQLPSYFLNRPGFTVIPHQQQCNGWRLQIIQSTINESRVLKRLEKEIQSLAGVLPMIDGMNCELEIVALHFEEGNYSGADQVLQAIGRDLKNSENVESSVPHVLMVRNKYRLKKEMLNHIQGNPIENGTQQGKYESVFLLLREFAIEAKDIRLPPEVTNRIRAIDSEMDGEIVAEILKYCLADRSAWANGKAAIAISEARFFGLLAQTIASANDPELAENLDSARRRSIGAIEKLAKLMPNRVTDVVMNEADLIWIRDQDEFKTAWQEMVAGESN